MIFNERGTAVAEKPSDTRDIEDRAGVDSLDMLLAKRRDLVERSKELRALHGPFGRWDYKRKNMLEAKKVQARIAIKERGDKPTEAMIDAEAHADKQYEAFVDRGIADAISWIEMENDIAEVNDRIRNREIELRCYLSEPK